MLIKMMPKEIIGEGFGSETKIIIVRSKENIKENKVSNDARIKI